MESYWVKSLYLFHSVSVTILTETCFHSFLYWIMRKIIKIHTKESPMLQPAEGTDDAQRHWWPHDDAFIEKVNTVFLFSLVKQLLDSGLQTEKTTHLSLMPCLISRKDVWLILQFVCFFFFFHLVYQGKLENTWVRHHLFSCSPPWLFHSAESFFSLRSSAVTKIHA